MDVLTHALLGATVSYAALAKPLKKSALWIGALAAMAPDLDVFISSNHDPLLSLIYHRNFTHSLIFIPFGGLIIGALLLLCFKSLRSQWPYVLLAAIIAYATHSLLDACTSYGTLLLWPFSQQRIAWDIISIVDPIFTSLLLIGVIIAYYKQSRYPALIALALCLAYLGFGYAQHTRALNAQQQLAITRGQTITKGRAMPKFGHLFGFNSVYISQHTIYLDSIKIPLFKSTSVVEGIAMPLFMPKDLPAAIAKTPTLLRDFYVFNWFADGYVGRVSQQPLQLADLRYVRSVKPLHILWFIEFPIDLKQPHVYWRHNFKLN